jgi:hypothetical protein
MFKAMGIYFSPMLQLIAKITAYKKGFQAALYFSIMIEGISSLLQTSFLGVSTSFLLLISIMFLIDFWTGVIASKYEYNKAIKDGDIELAKDKKFQSNKITFTFFKFIMLFLWIWLASSIQEKIINIAYLSEVYEIIAIVPLVLITLREYVSVGENFQRKYGNKPYIFTLVEKIFEALQFKFIKKIEGEDNGYNSKY